MLKDYLVDNMPLRNQWNRYKLAGYAEQPDHALLKSTTKITDGTNIASVTEEGYQDIVTHSDHRGDSISFGKDDIAVTTGYVLIDLSDVVNYPHVYVHHIGIDWVIVAGLADSNAVGHYDVGFITRINGTNSDWYLLLHGHFDKKEQKFKVSLNFVPQSLVCLPSKHVSGGCMNVTNDATFNTGATVEGVYGNPTPAVGDIILKVTRTAGQGNLAVVIGYHSHENE